MAIPDDTLSMEARHMEDMNMVTKKTLLVFIFASIFLLSLSVVSAEGESCTATSDCASGEVCEGSVCTAYCTIGETECSDGIDNEGDGSYDYWGACFIGPEGAATLLDCSAFDFAFECENSCRDYTYESADSDCRSPLDNDESGNPGCADGIDNDGDTFVDYPDDSNCLSPEWDLEAGFSLGAPEEVNFWQRLLDWITFWN